MDQEIINIFNSELQDCEKKKNELVSQYNDIKKQLNNINCDIARKKKAKSLFFNEKIIKKVKKKKEIKEETH